MRFASLALLPLIAAGAVNGAQQQQKEERLFKDPDGRYEIVLRDLWEPVTYQDGAGNTVTDIVYENSEEGVLKVRQFKVDPGTSTEAYAKREEEISLRFRPSYVRGSLEAFSGTYPNGVVFNFEFTRRGKRRAARYYYVKTDETTIYVLQFEGRPEVIRSMRNRTDLMARSFKLIK